MWIMITMAVVAVIVYTITATTARWLERPTTAPVARFGGWAVLVATLAFLVSMASHLSTDALLGLILGALLAPILVGKIWARLKSREGDK
ncbi:MULTISPECIES: hypothetical protein [unclassified Rhodococcus (in: high G+C Gram-positive bacteria)]|uniref:hypothetical protein n=1 Tax=unclassified Rhodococcus (in: high G+C Gram-positive bacteria) TaxID=192944 RepID=UPI000BD9FC75|nr:MULTISPECIES: hypothetical protein [unclassified Rhodococcus (in: high G+C Gram-positive bacteria)]MBP1158966.1 hypothetical protein [Rhodococcus sp. PvR099]PTR38611.1 hypothetical protein C8K38_11796 [Rhodococcus sp. OK611]SNX92982.1 hypothetical protein SAMN05447004_11796 [Rhodococcus sp. OK270]